MGIVDGVTVGDEEDGRCDGVRLEGTLDGVRLLGTNDIGTAEVGVALGAADGIREG